MHPKAALLALRGFQLCEYSISGKTCCAELQRAPDYIRWLRVKRQKFDGEMMISFAYANREQWDVGKSREVDLYVNVPWERVSDEFWELVPDSLIENISQT